jgi:hypothetical protein
MSMQDLAHALPHPWGPPKKAGPKGPALSVSVGRSVFQIATTSSGGKPLKPTEA